MVDLYYSYNIPFIDCELGQFTEQPKMGGVNMTDIMGGIGNQQLVFALFLILILLLLADK